MSLDGRELEREAGARWAGSDDPGAEARSRECGTEGSRWAPSEGILAQVLRPLALVGLDEDPGLQREAVDFAAQLVGDGERLDLLAAAESQSETEDW